VMCNEMRVHLLFCCLLTLSINKNHPINFYDLNQMEREVGEFSARGSFVMNEQERLFRLSQGRAPIYEALEEFKKKRIVPFDVPGHKRGRGNPELTAFLGEQAVSVDVNSMKPLDNLCHPVSVIKEAEELAAEAFGAAHAFFMVNGTTSAVQGMVLTACKAGDKIILPRNVHRSVINALVLCGAVPVYVNPEMDKNLGIALGMSLNQVEKAIKENPEAKAILVNNPTYYGICSDLRGIVKLAHQHNMLVLADEAHGAHLYFGKNLPVTAMAAGADMASVSMHKSGGSLTQSSFMLMGPSVNVGYARQIVNLTQTTSGSYLLLSSLDLSRRNLALNGERIFDDVINLAEYVRNEINQIGNYYAFSRELVNGDSIFDFDVTKLSVHTLDIGLAGIEVYDLLRDEYDIQIEFGDIGNILAYVSVGDRKRDVERLISALSEIRRRYSTDKSGLITQEYIDPEVVITPQEAFYADKESLSLRDTEGRVCSEFVMCYPPGIPILAPGERITKEIIEYIDYAKAKGCSMTGPEDLAIERLNVLKGV
jgi:arginine decarboxylase